MDPLTEIKTALGNIEAKAAASAAAFEDLQTRMDKMQDTQNW